MARNRIRFAVLLLCCSGWTLASAQTLRSVWSDWDPPLDTNSMSAFWRGGEAAYLDSDPHGKPDPRFRTEIRTRWTNRNLYLLFICPYEQLYLKPNPVRSAETNELWNFDVAEAFIGSDFEHIRRYKEFEVSPQGEWIDLDIDLDGAHPQDNWKWNSAFEVSARIDEGARVWYGAMKIPYAAIDTRPAAAGNMLRLNLFRSQGPPSARHELAWQAPMSDSFHVPEHFGLLELVKQQR